jgi:hypothetical protein
MPSAWAATGAQVSAAPSSNVPRYVDEARLPCESVDFKVY